MRNALPAAVVLALSPQEGMAAAQANLSWSGPQHQADTERLVHRRPHPYLQALLSPHSRSTVRASGSRASTVVIARQQRNRLYELNAATVLAWCQQQGWALPWSCSNNEEALS